MESRARTGAIALTISLGLHGALYFALSKEPPPKKINEVVEIDYYEPPPPPPPQPEPEKEPEPEPEPVKAPEPPKVVPKQKVAAKPPPEAPPPPNQPPPEKPPEKPAPIRIGVSLSSTTEGGDFAVGVGNTLYGKTDEKASDPAEAKPYAATETKKAPFVPSSRVTTMPRARGEPKKVYPKEAERAGIEGQVIVRLKIDETGKVVSARVVRGLGYGLDENAVEALRALRFDPATVDGEPVGTEITFTMSYYLEN